MKDINSLLKLFVSDASAWHDWSKAPFKIEDKVYATDRRIMLIIPAEHAPDVQPLEGYAPSNVLSVIPAAGAVLQTILAKDILTALKAVPTVKEDKECEACKGEGEVEFEFYHGGRTYTTDSECPICDGEGSFPDKDGKTIPDPEKSITIGKSNFAPKNIKKLYQICQHLDLVEIDLVSQPSDMAASLFSKNGISLLAMPVKDIESVYTIK